MEQKFSEFNEFSQSDKSLKRELGSMKRSLLSHLSYWHSSSILVSTTRGGRLEPFYCNVKYFSH